MKILNKNGLKKIVDYLTENKLSNGKYFISEQNGKAVLIHQFNDKEKQILESNNIKCSKEGHGFILIEDDLDQTTTVQSDEELGKTEETSLPDDQIDKLVQQIIPKLNEVFPTKDQVNNVLQKLRDESIDAGEWIDNLKILSRRIKKDSSSKLSESASIHPGLHTPTSQGQTQKNELGDPSIEDETLDDSVDEVLKNIEGIADKSQIKVIDPTVTDIRKPPNLANI